MRQLQGNDGDKAAAQGTRGS